MSTTSTVVNTLELKMLLEAGVTVRLPQVSAPGGDVLQWYSPDEIARFEVDPGQAAAQNPITHVVFVGQESVQCLSISDDRHLYLTDDFIPTHNTSNIIYLKSTDDTMLETLEKLSGKRHVAYRDSKSVSQDVEKMVGTGRVEGKVSYTISVKEEPLISTNDLLYLAPRNSVVFRAGDAPIWNRNETILPMSWRLFQNTIRHYGHEYNLQTIPTMSTAAEFDVRMNQPDFGEALQKRLAQATEAQMAKDMYMELYGFKEIDVKRQDPDVYSAEVMMMINHALAKKAGAEPGHIYEMDPDEVMSHQSGFSDDEMLDNFEQQEKTEEWEAKREVRTKKRYAQGMLSREELTTETGAARVYSLDNALAEAYRVCSKEMEMDEDHFSLSGTGALCSADGRTVYIRRATPEDFEDFNTQRDNPKARAFGDTAISLEDDLTTTAKYEVMPEFYMYLASLESWGDLAGGLFDDAVAREVRREQEDHA